MIIKIKNGFIPRLLSAVLFFSASYFLYGQEHRRETIDYRICDTSIVREVSKDSILNYNHTQNTSTLMLVKNILNMPTKYIEPLYINDIEMFGDWILFCGYMLVDESESVKKAMVGYYSLDSFPNGPINYYLIEDCKELKKLDFYQIETEPIEKGIHLVMTGTTDGTRSDVLVDVPVFVIPGDFKIYFSDDDNENFDDVAVTADYVVVSSRNRVQEIPIIEFLYFKKPSYTGQHIFLFPHDRFFVYNPVVETPVFLEHVEANNYVAVYKVEGFSRIAMLALNVANASYRAFEIMADQSWPNIPIDIKYSMGKSIYCILARVRGGYNPNPPTQIYRVTSDDLLGNTSNGLGLKYTENYTYFWSLDRLTDGTQRFVTSGGTGNLSTMLWFDPLQVYGCADRFVYQYNVGKLNGSFEKDLVLDIVTKIIPINEYENREKNIPFPVKCATILDY